MPRQRTRMVHMLPCVLLFVILLNASAKVCFSGYVMDTYCLDLGHLLDNKQVVTLEQPSLHSLHCLVDVRRCYASSFNMLVRNPSQGGTPYCVAYNLGHEATNAMLQRAREHGRKGFCSTCLNQTAGAQERGFRATVTGDITPDTTSSLGVPILSNVQIVGVGDVPCPQGLPKTVPTTELLSCNANPQLVYYRAHGACMLLSWGFLLPAGVIAAHFLRHRKPLWFKIHRAVQMTGLVLATIGWVIALTQFEVFGQGVNVSSLHGGLGMIVMVLGLLQPINAFFRPHPEPKTRKRDIWEHVHKKSGYVAVSLGIVTVAIGTSLVATVQKHYLPAFIVALVILVAGASLARNDATKTKMHAQI